MYPYVRIQNIHIVGVSHIKTVLVLLPPPLDLSLSPRSLVLWFLFAVRSRYGIGDWSVSAPT